MTEPSLAIVIRTAGERTVSACHELIARQALGIPIEIVSERPFEAALAKTYEIGLDLSRDWTMTLDGDVLLRKGALGALIEAAATVPDHYAQIEGRIFDKLLGTYRHAGHRLYRTRLLEKARAFIPRPGDEIRPEFSTLRKLALSGFPSRRIGAVVGIHDFEQYYGDLLRKSFVHGNKHREFARTFIERARSHVADDADYLVLLRGYWKGLDNTDPVHIDRASIKDTEAILSAMGLTEKDTVASGILDFDFIEAVLAGTALPDDRYPYDLHVNGEWGPEGANAFSSPPPHEKGQLAGLLERLTARLRSGSRKSIGKAQ
ncbi:hypothetical protein [Kaistia terrae]|uniref:Glycosyl transferase family 2 n=1 Tax=Kaistia terrae TaxID=537017 RepID=A0ABW0Q175_9HYPH|nr:hypothetical protein [Kaistia terrae]MCX5578950.1 hypothetical protein [Kaistia terrae]